MDDWVISMRIIEKYRVGEWGVVRIVGMDPWAKETMSLDVSK